MPAYIFPQAHFDGLEAGRQRLAFQAPRNAGSSAPHADLGGVVRLSTGAHGGARRQILPARVCILRATVVILPDALTRVIDLRWRERDEHTDAAEQLARFVQTAEHGVGGADTAAALDTLARLAGFADWPALYAYNSHRDHRGRPEADSRVTRELIGWNV
jgi:hypothetical protein